MDPFIRTLIQENLDRTDVIEKRLDEDDDQEGIIRELTEQVARYDGIIAEYGNTIFEQEQEIKRLKQRLQKFENQLIKS